MLLKVGAISYRLDLPPEAKIHPIFHVSCLKLKLGQKVHPIRTLPPMDADGQVCVEPIKVLQTRSRSLRSRKIIKVLVQWIGCSSKDATWESLYTSASSFLPSPCGQGVSIEG